jgi:hypothetical protein
MIERPLKNNIPRPISRGINYNPNPLYPHGRQ